MRIPPTIQSGDKGEDVELAQYELCRELYLDGPGDVDGNFGGKTAQAVRMYQIGRGLTPDEIVGPQTWTSMLNTHPDPPTLSQGLSGPVVSSLQSFLDNAMPPASPPLVVDGQFGPRTKSAVAAYQGAHLVAADGIVGYQTWVIHIGALSAMVASQVGV